MDVPQPPDDGLTDQTMHHKYIQNMYLLKNNHTSDQFRYVGKIQKYDQTQ
jgi:hypothetical protein